MDQIHIEGGAAIHGEIKIAGAKNAALPLMVACLLSDQPLILSNVPHLMDITTMAGLLVQHGVDLSIHADANHDEPHEGRVITLHASEVDNLIAPYDIVRKMRASVWVLGPLVARFGYAKVSLPGGCAIGTRPVDMHLKALEQMGVTITLEGGYIIAEAPNGLVGTEIAFDKVSVGATITAMMAASLAKGETVIRNAAREPEVSDVVRCMMAMGAQIEGVETDTLVIKGEPSGLKGAHYRIIPDRIEAGTYAIAAAITGGELLLRDVHKNIMATVIQKLEKAGVGFEDTEQGIRVKRKSERILPVDIDTQPYPGFPTDLQAQMMALMCVADGASVITENIFENRFMHVSELMRLGADITIHGSTATIRGVKQLKAAQVMATDLRASVSLILAALVAEGTTEVNRVYHLDRGYEWIDQKLAKCGARIRRVHG